MVIFFITFAWAETIMAKAARPIIERAILMLSDKNRDTGLLRKKCTAAVKEMLIE